MELDLTVYQPGLMKLAHVLQYLIDSGDTPMNCWSIIYHAMPRRWYKDACYLMAIEHCDQETFEWDTVVKI